MVFPNYWKSLGCLLLFSSEIDWFLTKNRIGRWSCSTSGRKSKIARRICNSGPTIVKIYWMVFPNYWKSLGCFHKKIYWFLTKKMNWLTKIRDCTKNQLWLSNNCKNLQNVFLQIIEKALIIFYHKIDWFLLIFQRCQKNLLWQFKDSPIMVLQNNFEKAKDFFDFFSGIVQLF